MDELNKTDVLFVGAGPASLAGAIRLKQLLKQKGRNESVVVIEKASKPGQHNLSGAVFEAEVLDDLIPDWKERKDSFVTKMLANQVARDEMVFLLGESRAIEIPKTIIPPSMHHKGNYVISVSEMVNWLANIARGLGIEIYTGFAAKELISENSLVRGVKLGDKGLNKEREQQPNYTPGDVIEAKVTVFGEGSLGQLAEELVKRFNLGYGKNPQVRSLGVKEIIKLPEKNNFGPNRVIHTLGFPNKTLTPDVFGGGTLYSMGENVVAISLLLALNWRYCDLNPQQELQVFKSHRFIKSLIEGGEVIAYGAKTLSEGGYYSLTRLVTDGALIIGGAAGLASVKKLKGLHYAIKSGMVAAEAIAQAIEEQDFSKRTLGRYESLLRKSFVMKDIQAARNYRQVFTKAGRAGLYLGIPLSFFQQWIPSQLDTKPDFEGMTNARLQRQYKGGIDRLTAVSLSGTEHREDEPSHITFIDTGECARCGADYGCHPCEYFCPGEVYRFEDSRLFLSPSNCLHCQTCRIKCPNQIIKWEVPEGGDGPKYKIM
ncbi:MAG: electron-transfer flavoprotein:ubiquinone oxidoreductase [Dehalococcoidia bacterium]|nr:electron-transfer flavoprotein:ubiquinone oxidoreductase [Dehalococcoidia bacterium]